ncbi:single-stranded DNA-binding protein [Hydrogenimonas thermophila]|uniref:Single-stranded DNA-binding protein n=1 Tax=Hydrogenimonas thermophila TaxID=223786 RepID=A0A1I5MKB8_9BACT|nr:single-stranded DNA-binding protein [Hydrogenimonas thermophila]WOE70935.1 single-stranded DNA-binding protein [Hydrogenimonas thermophila]WOE73453.1 single-stranded DNA-binding protein [Hydrogenimonas thermophila]SFP10042.1 single-strand binding protein [Hydrogenimonas thermophila]
MFNKVILIGNLTRDVELRYLPSGQALAKCGIATNRRFKDSSGMQKDETMFIDFTVWGRSAEIANQYLRKGSKVLIEGRLTLEQWTDQNGQKRSKHSITVENLKMLDRRSDSEQGHQGGTGYDQAAPTYNQPQSTYAQPAAQQQYQAPVQQQTPAQQPVQELPTIDIDEDDIPF